MQTPILLTDLPTAATDTLLVIIAGLAGLLVLLLLANPVRRQQVIVVESAAPNDQTGNGCLTVFAIIVFAVVFLALLSSNSLALR